MSYEVGMGTCLVQKDNSIPCGRQIEQGEPVRSLILPMGGAIVGHKACVDAYETRKQAHDMVKIAQQQGPGGAVDMAGAKDALVGSIPLEHKPGDPPTPNSPPPAESDGVSWPEDVIPAASVPMDSSPWLNAVVSESAQVVVRDDPEDLPPDPTLIAEAKVLVSVTELMAILESHEFPINGGLVAELLTWKSR